MFKKTLLALAVAGFSGAAFAGASVVVANGTGINSQGVIGGANNDTSIIVSSEGVIQETILDTTTAADNTIVFTVGDVTSVLPQYASLEKIRITITGADFNPATSLTAAFKNVKAAGADVADLTANGSVKYTASNVVELTLNDAGVDVQDTDFFTFGGFAYSNFPKTSGGKVVAKVEAISNVGGQVIDSASVNHVSVVSTVGSYIASANRFNNIIDVTKGRKQFTNSVVTDTLQINTYNDTTDAYAAVTTSSAPKYTVKGDFSFLDADGDGKVDSTVTVAVNNSATVAPSADFSSLIITSDNSGVAAAADEGTTLTITTDGARELPTGAFYVDSAFNYADASSGARSYARADIYGGFWDLNGTNVNVPYLPVGYETLSANLEIANTSAVDGEISVSGFDQNGTKYDVVKLSKVAKAKAVTKVSEADLVAAFGLTAGTKLSLDITVNTPTGISVYPYYRENDVRVSLPTSQYRSVECKTSIGGAAADIGSAVRSDLSTTCTKD